MLILFPKIAKTQSPQKKRKKHPNKKNDGKQNTCNQNITRVVLTLSKKKKNLTECYRFNNTIPLSEEIAPKKEMLPTGNVHNYKIKQRPLKSPFYHIREYTVICLRILNSGLGSG